MLFRCLGQEANVTVILLFFRSNLTCVSSNVKQGKLEFALLGESFTHNVLVGLVTF